MRPYKILSLLIAASLSACAFAQTPFKVKIDNLYTAKGYTVYRPENIAEAAGDSRLPVLVFANGGCSRSSHGYANMLKKVASEGYIVIAVGSADPERHDGFGEGLPYSMLGREDFLVDAVDWICREYSDSASIYFHKADIYHIALAGHSCGGAQAIRAAYDPRVSTIVMMNSGMGTMNMAKASPGNIDDIHCPILYVIGGPEDVAYKNADVDFKRIKNAPVACANFPFGHNGTYDQTDGGLDGKVLLMWLDWQLKGKTEESRLFTDKSWRKKNYPECDYKSKNIKK